jgi:hypothetical protein
LEVGTIPFQWAAGDRLVAVVLVTHYTRFHIWWLQKTLSFLVFVFVSTTTRDYLTQKCHYFVKTITTNSCVELKYTLTKSPYNTHLLVFGKRNSMNNWLNTMSMLLFWKPYQCLQRTLIYFYHLQLIIVLYTQPFNSFLSQ